MYNRYSYTRNNPLNATDPSGYIMEKAADIMFAGGLGTFGLQPAFKTIGPQASGFAVSFGAKACGPFAPACAAYGTYHQSRAFGASRSEAAKAAAISGASAYAFQQIGDHFRGVGADNAEFVGPRQISYHNFGGNLLSKSQIAQQISAHAVVGGVIAKLQGGKFGHGFISAGVVKAATPLQMAAGQYGLVAGTAVAAVIGGTTSSLTGGKFANGAQTAAYQYLFNAAGDVALSPRNYFMKHGVYPRVNGKRRMPSFFDKVLRGARVFSSVDVSKEMSQVVSDAYDHENFQKGGTVLSLTIAAGSLTPCSLLCANASLTIDGILIADEYFFGADAWSTAAVAAPTAAGLTFQHVMTRTGLSPTKVNILSVTATFMTTAAVYNDYQREK